MSASESEILSESKPALTRSSPENLQQQVESLRSLLIGALMALFLLSVAVNLFLYRQDSLVRKELAAVRAGSRNLLADFEANKQPLIQRFISKLQEYAKAHPDFQPVLRKYNIPLETARPQSVQPPASAPASAQGPSQSP